MSSSIDNYVLREKTDCNLRLACTAVVPQRQSFSIANCQYFRAVMSSIEKDLLRYKMTACNKDKFCHRRRASMLDR